MGNMLFTKCFDNHLHAFRVVHTKERCIVKMSDLTFYKPFNIQRSSFSDETLYIVPSFTMFWRQNKWFLRMPWFNGRPLMVPITLCLLPLMEVPFEHIDINISSNQWCSSFVKSFYIKQKAIFPGKMGACTVSQGMDIWRDDKITRGKLQKDM